MFHCLESEMRYLMEVIHKHRETCLMKLSVIHSVIMEYVFFEIVAFNHFSKLFLFIELSMLHVQYTKQFLHFSYKILRLFA